MSEENLRILLIDDNPNDRALAARVLRGEFPAATIDQAARSAEDWKRLVDAGGFDVVVTDFLLRWGNGLQVLREVKQKFPDVPVVMFTGTGTEEIVAEGLRQGLDDYITKSPTHYPRLAVAVRAALNRARFERDRDRLLDELQRAKEAAEEASRMKDEFLAIVSHELRTPLNAILGWASLLRGGTPSEEDLAQGLETIERNARSQAQLVDDLLDVSRIVSGRLKLDVRPVELVPIVEAAIDTVNGAAQAKGVAIRQVLDTSLGPVSGDPGRLQQVVWNLLSNAVKFTPKGGQIHVRLERVDSKAEISVSDDGAGIDKHFLPHVFDRFRQFDSSATREQGGLGLGLAIVKNLVELHGGTVQAKSPGPDQGTTFIVTIPLAPVQLIEARKVALPEPESPPVCIAGVNVLVVDDEPDARLLLARILEGAGAKVRTAASSAEALEALRQQRPDVLVSDVGMPVEDGYSLMRKIRERETGKKRLAAVALSAFARPEDRKRAMLSGYQMHLPKPVDPAELVAVIANLAGKP